MTNRVIKSDSYRGDVEPVADLGLCESLGADLTGNATHVRRRCIRRIETIRGAHVAKPTIVRMEVEILSSGVELFLTTKASREVAKGLLENLTVEEIVADAELIAMLRTRLSDVNNFGR
jgi:hypothetical protein